MRAAGPPLREIAGPPRRGVGPLPTARLIVDKATRDQMVIFDPQTAPLLRRIVRGADIYPWRCDTPRYLLALPAGWTAATFGDGSLTQAWDLLAERYPLIQQRLAPYRPTRQQPWWELSTHDLALFDHPQLVWPSSSMRPRFALTTAGQVAGPGVCHVSGSSFLLGILMSRPAWLALSSYSPAGHTYRLWPALVGKLPVPEATEPQRAAIGALAQRIAELSRERAGLERDGTRRLLRDFGPPGATPGPRLERWWNLDFAALRAELAARFGGDIPPRFRDAREAEHATASLRHAALSDTLALAEETLNTRVATLYGLV